MMLIDNFAQPPPSYVCVNLRGGNIRVAEHDLNASQVRTALDKVRREAMAKNMGRQVTEDTSPAAMTP